MGLEGTEGENCQVSVPEHLFLLFSLQNQDSSLPMVPPHPPFVLRHGVRNSLLLAPMPTASTAQILGNNESIEPYTSNIYTRRVLSGEFQVSINATEYFTVCKSKEKVVESVSLYVDCESPLAERPHRQRTVE